MFVRARYFAVFPMLCFISYANVAEGLIVSGLDTIHYPHEFGFDFVRMESCTSYSMPREGGCWNHFHFVFTQPGLPSARFDLSLQAFGYGISSALL